MYMYRVHYLPLTTTVLTHLLTYSSQGLPLLLLTTYYLLTYLLTYLLSYYSLTYLLTHFLPSLLTSFLTYLLTYLLTYSPQQGLPRLLLRLTTAARLPAGRGGASSCRVPFFRRTAAA